MIFAIFPSFTMAHEIFLQSQNALSKRLAVLEDNGKVAFLYLTEPQKPKPVKDAIVYSRIPPVSAEEWDRIRKSGDTPLLPENIASPTAVISSPEEAEFTFKWAGDGQAVAILRNGAPLAFVTISERFGFSKAVTTSTPFANPWNQEIYDSILGR